MADIGDAWQVSQLVKERENRRRRAYCILNEKEDKSEENEIRAVITKTAKTWKKADKRN